jgi:hypothetical protein
MDQGPLLADQIRAGEGLISSFQAYAPLLAAFWLKLADDGNWFLYLASDQFTSSNTRQTYAEVLRLVPPETDYWLDPFQVKVAGADHPIVRDIVEMRKHSLPGRPIRLDGTLVGGQFATGGYVYPLPVAAASPT